jgi:hypothetical protein
MTGVAQVADVEAAHHLKGRFHYLRCMAPAYCGLLTSASARQLYDPYTVIKTFGLAVSNCPF